MQVRTRKHHHGVVCAEIGTKYSTDVSGASTIDELRRELSLEAKSITNTGNIDHWPSSIPLLLFSFFLLQSWAMFGGNRYNERHGKGYPSTLNSPRAITNTQRSSTFIVKRRLINVCSHTLWRNQSGKQQAHAPSKFSSTRCFVSSLYQNVLK